MKYVLPVATLLLISSLTKAAPIVYTNKASFLADLAALGVSTISESFEDDLVWADSRNTISSPGSTTSIISQRIVWTSNYAANNIATGTVGGSAPNGSYALYSLPHGMTTDSGLYCDSAEDPDIPAECFQNDGLKIESATGSTLYAFGGRVDSNTGTPKITFLLDDVDVNANNTDNVDNSQREGDLVSNWSFIGIIYTDGFSSVELRELKGKDFQQVLLFSDDFTIGVSAVPGDVTSDGVVNAADILVCIRIMQGLETTMDGTPCDVAPLDAKGDPQSDNQLNAGDISVLQQMVLRL